MRTSGTVDARVARLTDAVSSHVVTVTVLAALTILQTREAVFIRRTRCTMTSTHKPTVQRVFSLNISPSPNRKILFILFH